MATKLYVTTGECCIELGTFRNRQKAEEFWKAVRYPMTEKLGHIKPVYVETRRGRAK